MSNIWVVFHVRRWSVTMTRQDDHLFCTQIHIWGDYAEWWGVLNLINSFDINDFGWLIIRTEFYCLACMEFNIFRYWFISKLELSFLFYGFSRISLSSRHHDSHANELVGNSRSVSCMMDYNLWSRRATNLSLELLQLFEHSNIIFWLIGPLARRVKFVTVLIRWHFQHAPIFIPLLRTETLCSTKDFQSAPLCRFYCIRISLFLSFICQFSGKLWWQPR